MRARLEFEVLEDAVEVIDDAGIVAVYVHFRNPRSVYDAQAGMTASDIPARIPRRIPVVPRVIVPVP